MKICTKQLCRATKAVIRFRGADPFAHMSALQCLCLHDFQHQMNGIQGCLRALGSRRRKKKGAVNPEQYTQPCIHPPSKMYKIVLVLQKETERDTVLRCSTRRCAFDIFFAVNASMGLCDSQAVLVDPHTLCNRATPNGAITLHSVGSRMFTGRGVTQRDKAAHCRSWHADQPLPPQ